MFSTKSDYYVLALERYQFFCDFDGFSIWEIAFPGHILQVINHVIMEKLLAGLSGP